MPPAQRLALLRPAAVLVAHLPRLEVDASAGLAFVHGQPIAVPGPGANADAAGAGDANRVLAVFCEGRLLGVAAHDDGLARPRRVVAADPGASMQPG
jgi:hypothetical protein